MKLKHNFPKSMEHSKREGILQCYRPTSRNKKNLKQPNLLCKEIRKRTNKAQTAEGRKQ